MFLVGEHGDRDERGAHDGNLTGALGIPTLDGLGADVAYGRT